MDCDREALVITIRLGRVDNGDVSYRLGLVGVVPSVHPDDKEQEDDTDTTSGCDCDLTMMVGMVFDPHCC